MLRIDARPGLLVADPGEDARRHLDHRGAHAELGRRGGDLEPDQAAADDDEMPRGLEFGPQVHARGFRCADSGRAACRAAAAGFRARASRSRAPARRRGGACRRRSQRRALHDRSPRRSRSIPRPRRGPRALRPGDRRVMRRGLAEQHGLRQRRLLVGLARLVGEQRDGGGRESLLLGADRREHARGAAPDHHDVARRAHRATAACVLVARWRI